ncbi:MAG: hypothetical protein KGQ51_17590, partial [Planctomycetes bacterium]|nr:hypothetical protein [Planctomycetota bacterium]
MLRSATRRAIRSRNGLRRRFHALFYESLELRPLGFEKLESRRVFAGPPSISPISNVQVPEDTPDVVASFNVSDPDTPLSSLSLAASSSNQSVVPNASIQFSGTGSLKTIRLFPNANAFGTTTLNVTVSDGSNSASTSFLLNVTSVNDAPAGTDRTVSINEDAVYTFAAANFGFSDPNDSPANSLLAVRIATLPGSADGVLRLSGMPIIAGQSISVASIGSLTFTPTANVNGNARGAFTFQVQDNGGTANGGVDLDASPNTINFNIAAVNDAPAGADRTVGINKDAVYTFAATDFGFSDPNDSPANSLLAVRIATLPRSADGVLRLSGMPIIAGQSISVASIGGMTYTPITDVNGNSRGAFTFQVQDNGGTANGGIELATGPNEIVFEVRNVPLAPFGLAVTTSTDSTVSLIWNDVATETEYLIERSSDNSIWTSAGTVAANVNTFTNTGIIEGTAFSYRVIATN